MKKFLLLAVLVLATVSANAQARFSGTIGATAGCNFVSASKGGGESNQILPITFNGGIGAKFDNGLYVGAGLNPGVIIPVKGSNTLFYMPFYAQASYVVGHSWYADLKVGGLYAATTDNSINVSKTGFYVNVTPVGYSFNDHNSLGLGWNYDTVFKCHGVALTYQHTF